jgi:hypothetical protein
MREAYGFGLFDWGEDPDNELDLVVVGWSKVHRCGKAAALSSTPRLGFEPFTFAQHEIIMRPIPSTTDLVAAGLMIGSRFDTFVPERDMLRIIEIQRARASNIDSSGHVEGSAVGGHAVLTTVGEHGINQRVLYRWPDRLGERPPAGP